jgi:RNA polymerase sigma-54 factor
LLVQLEVLGEAESIPSLAAQAVQEGMDLLSRRAYPELARLLKISTNRAEELATFISANLNPFPARAHWGNNTHNANGPQVYHNADVVISRLNENDDSALVVEIVSPYSGSLRINSLFRQALQQAPENKAEQWQSALDEALLLVKCLQQRNHTMVRLMERLVTLQRQFILEGDAYLSPVTRAQLAIELELHESTISRAVSSKAVQLPNKRIIPLARLFDRSLHIRTALVEIINQEKEPLSDIDIARRLSDQGYPVARRTVAKYRSMEGILPARLRRPQTRQAQHA